MQKSAPHQIKKRKDGRYMIQKRGGGTINGEEKTKILMEAGLIEAKLKTKEPATEEAQASQEESPAE